MRDLAEVITTLDLPGGHAAHTPLARSGHTDSESVTALQEADGHLSVDNFQSLMKACLHREGSVGEAVKPVSVPWGSVGGAIWGGSPAFWL